MPLDERALFNDKPETRPGRYQCPKCHRTNDYSIRWVRRSKKDRLPPGADDSDRAKFAKLRDYLPPAASIQQRSKSFGGTPTTIRHSGVRSEDQARSIQSHEQLDDFAL